MNRKTALLLSVLAAAVLLLPRSAWAANTDLTTRIPAEHTLTLTLDKGAQVLVDGVAYGDGAAVSVRRHSRPLITLVLSSGTELHRAAYNGEDVTRALAEGTLRLPPVQTDGTLAVTVRSAVPRPATGDDGAGLYAACAGAAGVCVLYLLLGRKKYDHIAP